MNSLKDSTKKGNRKILHIGTCDKFIPPFIDFTEKNHNSFNHEYLLRSGMASDHLDPSKNIHLTDQRLISRIKYFGRLAKKTGRADKIILHGLFHRNTALFLLLQPWTHKRIHWIIWGGDLYHQPTEEKTLNWHITEKIKKALISRIGHLITHIKGDFLLAQQWYGAKGRWHECFAYPSNLHQPPPLSIVRNEAINILIGNSATPSNRHTEVFDKISPFRNQNIKLYCPLSYGSPDYADQVESSGKSLFGKKFHTLRSYISFEEYLSLLSKIDIALFNHNRQQGMGNITTLLGMGKTVYLPPDLTSSRFFTDIGVTFKDISRFDMGKISEKASQRNTEIISVYFSEENLSKSLRDIYEEAN